MTQIDEARERLTARAVAKLQGASTFYACHDYPELAEECAEIAQQLRAAEPAPSEVDRHTLQCAVENMRLASPLSERAIEARWSLASKLEAMANRKI